MNHRAQVTPMAAGGWSYASFFGSSLPLPQQSDDTWVHITSPFSPGAVVVHAFNPSTQAGHYESSLYSKFQAGQGYHSETLINNP